MVVFTCNHCGDSLQKPKVQKHYETRCRHNVPNLCCVDCLKDFHGDEFVVHTKCVSEAQRYGGKGFVEKASQNKGERKQNAWIDIVQSVLDDKTLSGSLRRLLEKVSVQPNTPRKKTKFINFVKSMDHRISQRDMEQAWDLLSVKLDMLKTPPNPNAKPAINGNASSSETNNVETEENGESSEKQHNGEKSKKQTSRKAESNGAGSDVTCNSQESATCVEVPEERLTKKEKKEKKKRAKYEAELKEIAAAQKPNDEELEMEEFIEKRSKKRKYEESNTEEVAKQKKSVDAKEEEFNAKAAPTEEQEPEEQMDEEPKSKKKKEDHAATFDWIATITAVLGSKEKDIALRKLQKKVINEYCTVAGTEVTHRVLKKYEKNLRKIPNIKIENDKVRLNLSEE